MPGFLSRLMPTQLRFVPSGAPQLQPSPIPPTHPVKNTPENRYERIQATEQMIMYTPGGITEGLGKFLQKSARDQYFEHPVASLIFTPFYSAARFCSKMVLGKNASDEEISMFLDDTIGGSLVSVGNAIKSGANIFALLKYKKLAKLSHNEKITKKAAEVSSIRNMIYLSEKLSMTLAGGLFARGHHESAVMAMLLSQSLIVALAPITIKANWGKIKNFKTNLKAARDASKHLFLNLTKGVWATATLGLFAYLGLGSSASKAKVLESLGMPDLPAANSARDFFDILIQNTWELPTCMIVTGAVLLVAPPALTLALNVKGFVKPSSINSKNTQEFSRDLIRTKRVDAGMGAFVDVLNMIGGYYTASLIWQPLGAIFNGTGSLVSFMQSRYRTKHQLI